MVWRFPLSAAKSAASLEERYNNALYDEDTPAGYHQRKKRHEEYRKKAHEAHQRQIAQQKDKWMETLTATEAIERDDWPPSGSVYDDVVGYITGPNDDAVMEIAQHIGGQQFRPRSGVLIWINNFG
jgi:hypothetical protein